TSLEIHKAVRPWKVRSLRLVFVRTVVTIFLQQRSTSMSDEILDQNSQAGVVSVSEPIVELPEPTKPPPVHLVDMSLIDVEPGRGRKDFSGVRGLAESIKEVGLLNPPIVEPVGGRFKLKAGERRFRAIIVLGWKNC